MSESNRGRGSIPSRFGKRSTTTLDKELDNTPVDPYPCPVYCCWLQPWSGAADAVFRLRSSKCVKQGKQRKRGRTIHRPIIGPTRPVHDFTTLFNWCSFIRHLISIFSTTPPRPPSIDSRAPSSQHDKAREEGRQHQHQILRRREAGGVSGFSSSHAQTNNKSKTRAALLLACCPPAAPRPAGHGGGRQARLQTAALRAAAHPGTRNRSQPPCLNLWACDTRPGVNNHRSPTERDALGTHPQYTTRHDRADAPPPRRRPTPATSPPPPSTTPPRSMPCPLPWRRRWCVHVPVDDGLTASRSISIGHRRGNCT